MQIEEMSPELRDALHVVWATNAERMPDEMRPEVVLDNLIFSDATRLYLADDALLVVGSIKPGLDALVVLLNHDGVNLGSLVAELRHIIDDLQLRRLTAQVPSRVKDVQRILEAAGFRREGHLRRSTFWNGQLVGLDIYGLYRDPPRDQARKANGKAIEATA